MSTAEIELAGELVLVARRATVDPCAAYLAQLRDGSRAAQSSALRAIAGIIAPGITPESIPWERLTHAHTVALRARIADRYAPATSNRLLAALRGVLKAAWRLGLMTEEDRARAADLAPVKGARPPSGRALARGELRAMFGQCDHQTARGARDGAILALLYGAGLRRRELVTLDLVDLQLRDGVPFAVKVAGKGGKRRKVFLPSGSPTWVTAWIGHRGDAPGRLFRSGARGGKVRGTALTSGGVRTVVARLARAAGILERTVPHDLRRTYASDLLDAGADLRGVRDLLGHEDVTTTLRYDRRGERVAEAASGLLLVPSAQLSFPQF